MYCTLGQSELDFEWLLFDFDNTLVDFHEASELAFHKTLKDYNIEFEESYYGIYGKINAKVWSDFEQKLITAEDIRRLRFTLFLKEIGIEDIDGLMVNSKYLTNLIEYTNIRPEVVAMLNRLQTKFKVSIITNGLKEVQRARLAKCKIDHLFDSIVVSDEIGVAKPDNAFFEYTISTIEQRIDKEKILVIGDSLKSDIAGAKLFGLKSCLISDCDFNKSSADIVLDDVLKLEELITDIYFPVNCDWYDYLEIYAMRKTIVDIKVKTDDDNKTITTRIQDLETKNKEEFALLEDGTKLRLDKIISINPSN
jgi:YjjG family noncanonical pyrimidine nucleotidase